MIELQVVRPMMMDGHRVEVGQRIQADPMTASAVLHSGRAVLIDPGDQQAINSAVAAQSARSCREAERQARRFVA